MQKSTVATVRKVYIFHDIYGMLKIGLSSRQLRLPQRPLLALLVIAICFFAVPVDSLANTVPVNIILILSDDVGAETIGTYGGESYQTPRLDRMAREGIRFDFAHAQPLCTPSRVKVMTGQYNFRNYKHFGYLDPAQMTFAQVLKPVGYSTAVVGKWQLYNNRFEEIQGSLPTAAGFDEFLLWQVKNQQKGSRYWAPLLNHNGEMVQHGAGSFGPDLFNAYVLNYIEAHTSTPFFLYYPMVLAHDPWVTTPDMQDESVSDQEKFAAMMVYMDKMVGNVIDKIEEVGIADRTLVLFIGDNGTDRDIVSRRKSVEVRGAKGETINTGTHVPFLAWGPGIVKEGAVSSSLVNLNDILPTLAEVAGVPLPSTYAGDGQSLVTVLAGEGELARENIFIHYEPRWPSGVPARYSFDRQWKLYEEGDFYDMRADPLEKSSLDVATLSLEAAAAHQSLQSRIDSMPGQLQSRLRWIPLVLYYYLAGGFLVLLAIGWLSWRVVRRSGR